MKVKAVLLDADGVVVFPWRFARYLERAHGITPEMTAPFFQGTFGDCLVGKLDLKAALRPFLPQWGWERSVDDFVSRWLEEENAVDARVVDVVRRLRSSGVACCLATNQEAYRAEYMATVMGFSEIFDRLVFSCQLGCQKPAGAYYDAIAGTLGLAGRDILVWDDSPANVAAAQARGWHAEVYTDVTAFEDMLRAYLGPQILDDPSEGQRSSAERG